MGSASKTTIVSASDARFFPLLKGLVQSIHDQRPDDSIVLSALDTGMTPAQRDELSQSGVVIATAGWHYEFPSRDQVPWFRAMTERCHLPEYFPGYDYYVWIDADAWLQDWRAIELLLRGAESCGFSMVPEIHAGYRGVYFLGLDAGRFAKEYQPYSDQIARVMTARPTLNSGVLCLRHDSPVWQKWAQRLSVALQGEISRTTEQSALSVVVCCDNTDVQFLPAWCNWICGQALPVLDTQSGKFCESILPFPPLSIIHVTPRKCAVADIRCLDGKMLEVPLDYLAFKAWREARS